MRGRWWVVALFFGFLFLYGSVQNIGYFDASDSYHRFRMMQALVTTGSPYWMEADDGEPRTCLQTIGPAVAALPAQAVGFAAHRVGLIRVPLEQVLVRATLLNTVFITALWMGVLAVLCRRLGASRGRAILVVMLAGTATLIFPYSKSAQGENLVGLCITALMLLLLRLEEGRGRWRAGTIGLLYGFLLTCKPELAVVFPLLLVAVLAAGRGWRVRDLAGYWRRGVVFCAGIVPGVLLIFWYNYVRFGSVSNSGTLGEVGSRTAMDYFSHPFWEGLYIQLFSPGKGVFWYSPVLFASLPFVFVLLRRRTGLIALPYVWWAVMTCLYAKFFTPTGDAALGSRFQVSYVGFGVLPLVMMPPWREWRGVLMKGWIGLCAVASFGLQVLFCAVSFNIDYHRRLSSVQTLEEQVMLARRAYFGVEESLLRGFIATAREGLLDLYFVRLRPLEAALTVLPGFWWLLAGAACGFGAAVYLARWDSPGQRSGLRVAAALQAPAVGLAVLAVLRVGHPGESGLRLEMSNALRAVHHTVVQDVAVSNMNDGREVYKVHRPFSLRWIGEIYCPAAGRYGFRVDSNQPMRLRMAHQEHGTGPGVSEVEFVVLDAGWQPLEMLVVEGSMHDRFVVETRFPGESAYEGMGERRLKR